MAGASADAFRLAGFLAAAPLTLPMMRLIQHVMLPGGHPSNWPRFTSADCSVLPHFLERKHGQASQI